MIRRLLFLAGLALTGPAAAQDFAIDTGWIDRCVAKPGNRMLCYGQASHDCVVANGGGPNMVLAACAEAETAHWDAVLNEAYARLLTLARQREADDLGYAPDTLEFALREVQRAWIGYRDATCAHALSLAAPFGSAAGPAYQHCMGRQTARQYFELLDLQQAYRG